MSVETAAESLAASIDAETDFSPDADALEEDLERNVNEFGIPEDEAVRSVIGNLPVGNADAIKRNYFGSAGNGDSPDGSEHGPVPIAEVPSIGDEEWVDVRGKIVQMWEAAHDSIAAKFLIADDTDETLAVTVWQKSMDNNDWDSFSEGDVLRFDNVVTEEYDGKYSIKVNSDSVVAPVEDADFDPDANRELEFSAQFVGHYEGSGLIKRCPEDDCSRVLDNGQCEEHGQMDDFEWDLRIKAVIDDGTMAAELILDQEQVEALTGMDMTAAQEIARDTLDRENVIEELSSRLMGKTLEGQATKMGSRLIANDVAVAEDAPDAGDVLQDVRAQA
jgi:replication factor A1